MKPPPRWKMAVVIWIGVYPIITILFMTFGPELMRIEPLPLRTLVITLIAVPILVFILMPFLQKVLAPWLNNDQR